MELFQYRVSIIPNFFVGNVHSVYWFMYVLFGLYLLAPVLARFISNGTKTEHRYAFFMFSLMYIIGCVFPSLAFKLPIVGQFVSLFYSGVYLSMHRPSFSVRWWLLLVLVFGVFVWIARSVIHVEFSYDIVSFVMALLIFCAITSSEGLLQGRLLKKFIGIGSRFSFGIYLTHFMFISVLEKLGMYSWGIPSFVLVPLIALSAILLSFAFLAGISKVPYTSKLIGVR